MKALLIDDEVISNFVNTAMLKQSGLADEIKSVQDAREALQILNSGQADPAFKPDFILLDINMPIMNGFEFIEAFRVGAGQTNRPDIIILSSSSDPADRERASKLGISQYLTKPLSVEELKRSLEALGQIEDSES